MLWLAACAAPTPPAAAPTVATATTPEMRTVEVVLDRGRFVDGEWLSEPVGRDRLRAPAAPLRAGEGSLARGHARLPPGPGEAVVDRDGCGPARVPYVVDATDAVVLPYPACDARPGDALPAGAAEVMATETTGAALAAFARLGLLPDWPITDDDRPAAWLTLAEARAWCAWWGGRLPTEAEWRAAVAAHPDPDPVTDRTRDRWGDGPVATADRGGGPDLVGNLAEWLDDGRVAGGSWVSRDAEPRAVPASARTDTIGVRCAFDR